MIQNSGFAALSNQEQELNNRRACSDTEVTCCDMRIIVEQGVYATSGDSELMAESVKIGKDQTFLEVGCGSGVVSIVTAGRALSGIGVDINERAVENSKRNATLHNVKNVEFLQSNLFENVKGEFDVIICNPPYTKHVARDSVDKMFWDTDDEMKRRFFEVVGSYLKPNGRIYFGWADFADIDVHLPFHLAKSNGYTLVDIYKRPHKGRFNFYVLEFKK